MTNPENFDDGLTQVAPKGEFKPDTEKELEKQIMPHTNNHSPVVKGTEEPTPNSGSLPVNNKNWKTSSPIQIEKELEKGCGRDMEGDFYCGDGWDTICEICKAKLEAFKLAKQQTKDKILGLIDGLEHHHSDKCKLCGEELGIVYKEEDIDKVKKQIQEMKDE